MNDSIEVFQLLQIADDLEDIIDAGYWGDFLTDLEAEVDLRKPVPTNRISQAWAQHAAWEREAVRRADDERQWQVECALANNAGIGRQLAREIAAATRRDVLGRVARRWGAKARGLLSSAPDVHRGEHAETSQKIEPSKTSVKELTKVSHRVLKRRGA